MRVYDLEYKFTLTSEFKAESLDKTRTYLEYLREGFDTLPTQEQVWVLCLDVQHNPICRRQICIGIVDTCIFHMRELFAPALAPNVNASKIVMAHNHPSGNTLPSDADYKATENVKKAGMALGVPCIEHLILGDPKQCPKGLGHYSFADAGYLKDDFEPEQLTLK
jgi:DNA repair protein RadC